MSGSPSTSQPIGADTTATTSTSSDQCGESIRGISEWFSIQHEQLFLCDSVDGALNDSTLPTVKDAITAFCEWLRVHQGQNRIAIVEKRVHRRRSMHNHHLNVLFSTVLIDKPATRT